jgi:hypothetical protein
MKSSSSRRREKYSRVRRDCVDLVMSSTSSDFLLPVVQAVRMERHGSLPKDETTFTKTTLSPGSHLTRPQVGACLVEGYAYVRMDNLTRIKRTISILISLGSLNRFFRQIIPNHVQFVKMKNTHRSHHLTIRTWYDRKRFDDPMGVDGTLKVGDVVRPMATQL